MLLEHTLSKAYPTAWQLGIGITLVLVALYARNGILGLADALRRRWGAR
jgi:branched-chain amino acid transport system permease protein